MSGYTTDDVLASVWNDSGSERSSSDSEFEPGSDSESERDDPGYNLSENGEDTDSSNGSEQSEDEVTNNDANPQQRRKRPRRQQQQQQPALVWTVANRERPRAIPFTANSGIQVPTPGFEAFDYFSLFINDDLLNYFVAETNRFAEQFISASATRRRSRVNDWHPTDPNEMRQFLGLLFLTGIIRKPAFHLYWSKDPLYFTPLFGAIMTRNRFQLLLKFLHFNDNTQMPAADAPFPDKLFKIRPLLDHLCEKFGEVYTPSCNISIDESLLLWKGRLAFKQYIPLKRARFGIKCFMLCEDSGYTYRFKIYTGKENAPQNQGTLSVSERVVVDLMEPLLEKGYHLYIDNWYSSITLFKYLYEHHTQACGTVRINRRGFPEPVKQAKLRRGEVSAYRSSELLALKFKDKRDVTMLSTIHNEEMVQGRRNAAQQKPKCISDYNKYMGGVDRTDQLLQPYEIARKSLKWYKKLALHFLQLAMLNGFLLFKKDGGRKRFLEFQHDVISVLVFGQDNGAHHDIPREENVVRLTERHFVEQIPPTEGKQKAQKRCKVCYKKNIRKETRYYCPSCPSTPGLCYYPCFRIYHTNFEY